MPSHLPNMVIKLPDAWRALTRLLAWAVVCMAVPFFGSACRAAIDVTDEAILDEVVAGIEANEAMIQHGTATYTLKVRSPVRAQGQLAKGDAPIEESTAQLKVFMDYPRLRFVWRGQHQYQLIGSDDTRSRLTTVHGIRDEDRVIFYRVPINWEHPDREPPVDSNVVHIKPSSAKDLIWMHPREQWHHSSTLMREIEAMREDATGSMTVAREADGLIRIETNKSPLRKSVWVSPQEGYCLVRFREWYTPISDADPINSGETKRKRANNGAYVLEQRMWRQFQVVDKWLKLLNETEDTLVDLDLETVPANTTFALDDLALPAGARIIDAVRGTKFKYKSPAQK